MQMSPSDLAGIEVVGREVRQPLQGGGLALGEPEPVLAAASRNSAGPKPNVIVSPDGGSPIASPVSSGGASYGPEVGPSGPAPSPWVIRAAAAVQSCSSAIELVARRR